MGGTSYSDFAIDDVYIDPGLCSKFDSLFLWYNDFTTSQTADFIEATRCYAMQLSREPINRTVFILHISFTVSYKNLFVDLYRIPL